MLELSACCKIYYQPVRSLLSGIHQNVSMTFSKFCFHKFLPILILTASAQLASFSLPALSVSEPAGVSLSANTLKQGETLKVVVHVADGEAPPAVTFNKKNYKLFPVESDLSSAAESMKTLIGIPADIQPGVYKLQIGDKQRSITVKAGVFTLQRLRLPKGKDNFVSSPGEEEAVRQAKATVTPVQYWLGPFERPSQARTSTGFGQRRVVNGVLLKDYFHSGLDFAGGLGSPVVATQNGKVLLARKGWKLHGNTVALDHGQGVISFYIHLSKIEVKEGDIVDAGNEIGKIGSTGRASGPHLHFSLYVNGDSTNPLNWFNHSF